MGRNTRWRWAMSDMDGITVSVYIRVGAWIIRCIFWDIVWYVLCFAMGGAQSIIESDGLFFVYSREVSQS